MTSLEHVESGPSSRVVVTRSARGWELKEERDHRVVREAIYTDWHRVERAVRAFELEAGAADAADAAYSTNR
jgi:hypothetical protein